MWKQQRNGLRSRGGKNLKCFAEGQKITLGKVFLCREPTFGSRQSSRFAERPTTRISAKVTAVRACQQVTALCRGPHNAEQQRCFCRVSAYAESSALGKKFVWRVLLSAENLALGKGYLCRVFYCAEGGPRLIFSLPSARIFALGKIVIRAFIWPSECC